MVQLPETLHARVSIRIGNVEYIQVFVSIYSLWFSVRIIIEYQEIFKSQ